ncbi:metallophosphoesterase [Virgibacillus profundi]|uniref:Metallophosphoesterase n=1 Tax=Virgibacillus profundi TaxID=2024555 RepID=A0A2A2IAX6_9BACI|nr:metallophosphoesterase [Virgibacillus profundi]PAV28777.1 metallophosphoesterase [Virgibacillus profundi]PXY52945.1 metallophosphoesterase [Virgibacillus profundi]
MNRRSFLKKAFGSLLALVGLGGGTYYYAREIEPTLLEINNNIIASKKITSKFNNFKIIQFSDTHIGFHYSLKQFKKLIDKINAMKPDLIVFTGDLVDEPNNYNWSNDLIKLLHSLEATHGKYWIYGNHDHGGYGTNIVKDVMEQADFKLLKNSHTVIEVENEQIIFAGIDDVMLGNPDLNMALQHANPDLFTVLLAHEPDFADTAVKFPIDIQLSGHSHGGQVRLPFIGHLYTPSFAEKYVQGKYTIGNDKLALYVNSGIGTTRLPYRFLCKPEIHSYTLRAKQ